MPPKIVSTIINAYDILCSCGAEVPVGEGFVSLLVDGDHRQWVSRCTSCTPTEHQAVAQAHAARRLASQATRGTPLPCAVCGEPVRKGELFLLASQAIEDVSTGTPYKSTEDGRSVPQEPVHLKCLVPEGTI